MFGDRIEFSATLEVISDLHVGAPGAAMEQGNVKRLLYDYEARPLLPASTLKGVLRAASGNDTATFGTPTGTEQVSGIAAKLWLDDAPLKVPAEEASFAGRGKPLGPGVFLSDHVAIDRMTGAAENSKLYCRETVAKGGRFALSGIWLNAADIDPLKDILSVLAAGLSVGRGTVKGNGKIALNAEDLIMVREVIGADGAPVKMPFDKADMRAIRADIAEKAAAYSIEKSGKLVSLHLVAQGPYLSVREHKEEDQGSVRIAQPLQQDGLPMLRRESFMGVLRERASWLAELERAREKNGQVPTDAKPCDDRFRQDTRDLETLSPVERLFGVAGWRSRLHIVKIAPSKDCSPETMKLTSVSIDRITGASREKFLYTERVFTDARFDVTIAVDDDNESVVDAFERLIEDILAEGLEIGHGTTKGFGWFDVTRLEVSA